MICELVQLQGKGKSLGAVILMLDLVFFHGYDFSDVHSNIALKLPDVHNYNNADLREFIKKTAKEGLRHQIILIDEVDSVFPHRFFTSNEQTETLLGFWQDEKLFNWIFYTNHLTLGCDIIIRKSTQISVIPNYTIKDDLLHLKIINSLHMRVFDRVIPNVSRFFDYYDRWEHIK